MFSYITFHVAKQAKKWLNIQLTHFVDSRLFLVTTYVVETYKTDITIADGAGRMTRAAFCGESRSLHVLKLL